MKEYRLVDTDGFEKSAPLHELLNDVMSVGFTLRRVGSRFVVYDASGEHYANIFPVY